MNTFQDRLREERERLGLSQTAFGELGGVKKQAQLNYEKGERQPDARYLAGLAACGVDVPYLLTGVRLTDPGMDHNIALMMELTGDLTLKEPAQGFAIDAISRMPREALELKIQNTMKELQYADLLVLLRVSNGLATLEQASGS